jgi:hypothetical protein
MKKVFVNKDIYEVSRCLHCGEDTIEYAFEVSPWQTEHWICEECDSTYSLSNEEIAIKL